MKGLNPLTLNFKPAVYRKAVGVDHVSITPPDIHGNSCAIVVVEFPQVYAATTYDAETVARTLIKHYCTFGVFDELYSDPGSSFLSNVVVRLNKLLGVQQKISLVGRHESNGVESVK